MLHLFYQNISYASVRTYLQEPDALRASEDPDDLVGDDVDDLDPGEAGEGDEVAALVEGHVVVLEQVRLLQLLLHRHLPIEVVQLLDLYREGALSNIKYVT